MIIAVLTTPGHPSKLKKLLDGVKNPVACTEVYIEAGTVVNRPCIHPQTIVKIWKSLELTRPPAGLRNIVLVVDTGTIGSSITNPPNSEVTTSSNGRSPH